MGTSYTILKHADLEVELSEMSNLFSLDITGDDVWATMPESLQDSTAPSAGTKTKLTPEDVIGMALEMLKVASYWTGDDKAFEQAVTDHLKIRADRGYYADVVGMVVRGGIEAIANPVKFDGSPTGRMSTSEPNLQNIQVRTPEGAAIREAFLKDKGNP